MGIQDNLILFNIYFQILEQKPSSLPWLENKRLQEETQPQKKEGRFKDAPAAVWKPYISGKKHDYDHSRLDFIFLSAPY